MLLKLWLQPVGYTESEYRFDGDSCGVFVAIHEQSPDINQGVVREKKKEQGAGDQGMMFGYASKDLIYALIQNRR